MFLFQLWLSGIDTVEQIEVWASDEGSALKLTSAPTDSELTCPDFFPAGSDVSFIRK